MLLLLEDFILMQTKIYVGSYFIFYDILTCACTCESYILPKAITDYTHKCSFNTHIKIDMAQINNMSYEILSSKYYSLEHATPPPLRLLKTGRFVVHLDK